MRLWFDHFIRIGWSWVKHFKKPTPLTEYTARTSAYVYILCILMLSCLLYTHIETLFT